MLLCIVLLLLLLCCACAPVAKLCPKPSLSGDMKTEAVELCSLKGKTICLAEVRAYVDCKANYF